MAYLNLYVGTSEESWLDFIYLDLVISDGTETTLECSSMDIEGLSAKEFLAEMERICNRASLYSKELKIPLKIELSEFLEDVFDEDDENSSDIRNIKLLLAELKQK